MSSRENVCAQRSSKFLWCLVLAGIYVGHIDSAAAVTINKGDTVTIQAMLSTSDPNENGEGEPLYLQSSGGFSATISN